MNRKSYTSFRIVVSRSIGALNPGTCVISVFRLFSSFDGSGSNLFVGGTPSASSSFGTGFEAAMAFDNDSVSRWSSTSTAYPHWLRYDLPVAVKPGSFFLQLTNNPGNGPADFEIQGSNDGGIAWDVIGAFTAFATQAEITAGKFGSVQKFYLAGQAIDDGGGPAYRIHIIDYASGQLVKSLSPMPDGSWETLLSNGAASLLVVSVGTAGVRPAADGPLIPGTLT